MDDQTVARLVALPENSAKRREILATFGCYSMATVMLRIWQASAEEKQALEAKIVAVLGDPTCE